MISPFRAGGPLAAEDSLVYVERQGDVDALTWLTSPQQAADLLVVAPRQQGKTSCLYKLMRHPGLINYKFVYADLQNCNCTTEAEWYSDLWRELKPSYAGLSDPAEIPVPANARDWEDRMKRLAEAALQTGTRLVIVLDEIDVMRRARTESWSSRFFSTLRKLENARPINPVLRSLYFVFIGAFHPRDLVHDDSVSPFNIAQRVVLPDFTATQVRSLVEVGGWAEAQTLELADRIFYWTDGQPYLTQAICKTLRSGARSNDVDKAVAVFRQSDLIHLPPIIKRLKADPSLMEYIKRIEADHRVPFSQQDPESAESKLELLGVIKADSEGCCKVRNRLYREVLGLEEQKQHPSSLPKNASTHDPCSRSKRQGLEECSADKDKPALKQSITGVCGAGAPAPNNAEDAYVDLRHGLSQGEVCVFVGAGLSLGAGLPDWHNLIAELSARIGYKLAPREWATSDALIDAAQAYVNRQGLHSLISHLKHRLDTTGVQPTAAHRALARLPISLVFTANFDNLLERAFRDAGKRVEVIVKDSSIPFMRRGPDTVNIVKLYGDLDQPDTIVLARQQYESYFLQRPQMIKLLETTLATHNTLYLGWSGSDPYFKLVFGELLSRFGQMMRPDYAVMFDVTDDQRDELRRKQIRLIDLPAGDRTAALARWLDSLAPPTVPSSASGDLTSGKGDDTPASAAKPVLNTGKAWAVLVGVNQYENQPHIPSLHACVDDVTAVHAALAGKYTAARLLTDNTPERLPTRANILGELNSVAQAAGEGDLLLFYFSGHGIAEGGESYLLPRDARLSALTYTSVAMAEVRKIINTSPARAKVIVLDACHSGAAIGKAGPAMTLEFIQRVFTEAEGMAVLASCKQGQQSWEWPEAGRSVFTHFLLEALSGKADFDGKGFVTVSDVSRHVTDGVKAWAVDHGVPQTPTLQYTVAGDIVLLQV